MRVLFAIAHLDKGGGQAVQTSRLLGRLAPLVDGELLCLTTGAAGDATPPVPGTTIVGELRFPEGILALRRAIAERRPRFDLVHAFDPYYSLPAARLARVSPLVVRLGAHPVEDLESRYGLWGRSAMRVLNPWLYRHATVVVNAQHLLGAFPPGKATCIPNGIDATRYPANPDRKGARAELGLPADVPIVTFTGKIIPRKNVDDLYWLVRNIPEIHLLLVGSDNEPYYGNKYHRELQAQYADVRERVHAVGEVPSERVGRFLEASDIFVFPSRLEGMPNSALEAMAAGLPIVASDVQAHREILSPDAGILYSSREALAEGVSSLARDPTLRSQLGGRAKRVVQQRFSLESAAMAYLNLYETILEARRPRA